MCPLFKKGLCSYLKRGFVLVITISRSYRENFCGAHLGMGQEGMERSIKSSKLMVGIIIGCSSIGYGHHSSLYWTEVFRSKPWWAEQRANFGSPPFLILTFTLLGSWASRPISLHFFSSFSLFYADEGVRPLQEPIVFLGT